MQYIFFYSALIYGSGSLCGLLTATGSFWWLLLAPLFGKGTWSWRSWAVLCLGAAGVGLAVYSPADPSANAPLGVILMLVATLCGALAVLFFGKVKPTMETKTATGFSLFLGGLGLCCIGAPAIPSSPVLFPPSVIGITLYLALVSATAFSIWNELSTRYPVALLATYRFMIPIMGVILSIVFIPEDQFTVWILAGTSVIAVAMFLATRLNPKK